MRSLKAGAVALGFLSSLVAMAAEDPGACVSCHRTVEGVPYIEHNFGDWEKSVHSMAGVGCETCHGGDVEAKGKTEAHSGVISSTRARSPLYFTRIPATCGECHEAEFKAFKKSAHYQELKRSGRGPNCVTCHGSMANRILAPRELEMTCTLCHRRPTRAYATLMALNNATVALDRLRKALDSSPAGLETSGQKEAYETVRQLHAGALIDWHTFKMQEVLQAAQETTRRATEALNELRIMKIQSRSRSRKQ